MLLKRAFERRFCTATIFSNPQPWLFVGLGNPGNKFMGTRHNVGFEFIDEFAKSEEILMESVHFKSIFGKGFVNNVPVLLAKPRTYMNLSGEAIGPLAAYYKLPLNRVLVFHDDMDLPCGVLRLVSKGHHASHNGLKSVIHHFRGNTEFPRLRIGTCVCLTSKLYWLATLCSSMTVSAVIYVLGIGKPPGQMDPKAYLLQKFNAKAQQRIDASLEEGVGALKQLLAKGLTETATSFNKQQKYKHVRLQTMPV